MRIVWLPLIIALNLVLSTNVPAHVTPCAHVHGVAMRNLPNTCANPGAQEACTAGTVCTDVGVGTARGCTCLAPPAAPPKSASFSLLLRTTAALPGPARFEVVDSEDNSIKAFAGDTLIAELNSGITGSAQVVVEVLDDRIRLVPNELSFTTPSETLLGKITGENHSELVFDRLLLPMDFDRGTGAALNEARVTVRTVNRLFTEDNPLISQAVVGGTFDLASGTLKAEGYLQGSLPELPKSILRPALIAVAGTVVVALGIVWLFVRTRRGRPS
jgi:hypothetical protein